VLKGFAFALVIGVILGTYSSLFVASALVVELQKRAMQAK
jgi:preprotein translocase subunit SecF